MFEILFGNQTIEKILFYLVKNEECYGADLAKRFDSALYGIQRAFAKLERAGILVSFNKGRTRYYQFNPRYPFLKELRALLEKAFIFLPQDIQETYSSQWQRKRPRRAGKTL